MSDLDPFEIRRQSSALAEHLRQAGVAFLPKPDPSRVAHWQERFADQQPAEAISEPTSQSASRTDQTQAAPDARPITPPPNPSQSAASGQKPLIEPGLDPYTGAAISRQQRLDVLTAQSEQVAACEKCSALAQCRTQTVYGEGDAEARFVFFGEAPGADEDRLGRPFVGRAGQLLDKMIIACKLRREDVYILNTVKCRPPGNRNPEPEEIENCRDYFETQFNTLRPEYIICLGAVAAQSLLQTSITVGRLRGSLHAYRGSKVLVTYHPAYLLRNVKAKAAAWADLQLMLADAGISLTK